jgi:hypothetical protein
LSRSCFNCAVAPKLLSRSVSLLRSDVTSDSFESRSEHSYEIGMERSIEFEIKYHTIIFKKLKQFEII